MNCKKILLFSTLIGLSFSTTADHDKYKNPQNKEEFFCQDVKKQIFINSHKETEDMKRRYKFLWEKPAKKSKASEAMDESIILFLISVQYYFDLMSELSSTNTKGIEELRAETENIRSYFLDVAKEKEKEDTIFAISAGILTNLYIMIQDAEEYLKWFHKLADHFSSLQYITSLSHTDLCKKELSTITSLDRIYIALIKKQSLIYYPALENLLLNRDKWPTDYIQAYYWANLAIESQFPTAVELRELIIEKMSPEEYQQALNFSYY